LRRGETAGVLRRGSSSVWGRERAGIDPRSLRSDLTSQKRGREPGMEKKRSPSSSSSSSSSSSEEEEEEEKKKKKKKKCRNYVHTLL
jgi:hypothetical protein